MKAQQATGMPCKLEDWVHSAQQRGLLAREAFRKSEDTAAHCGVSLAYLEQLACSLKDGWTEAGAQADCSTAGVMQRLLMPVCARMAGKTRFWDIIPAEHTGVPQWYIIHAWSASFSETVASIVESLAPNPGPGEPPWPPGHKAGITLWINIFAVNHFAAVREHAETAAMVVEAQLICEQGLLLCVDRSLCVLNRAWPLYELYLYLYYAQQANYHLALPGGTGIGDVLRLHDAFHAVDISKAEATRPQDKTSLLSEIKRTLGLQRTNRQLQEELVTALHCRLRWTNRPEDKGSLAALLLQHGELAQLQLLLCGLPGLRTDDEALQDIRDIFKVYDADGSGQLDEDEFLQVMKAAGWSEEDALAAFSEVDTDHGGSVELHEFEIWWEKNQDANGCVQPPELRLCALASNLERLPTYMRRYGLTEHADYFIACMPSIAAAAAAAKANGCDQLLPAPVIRGGDVTAALNAVSDTAAAKQYRSACKAMHALLLANRVLLPFQPSMLQPPDRATDTLGQAQLLALYMCMFAQMLDYQGPDRASEVEYLYATAAELWEGPNAASQQMQPGGKPLPKPVESSERTKDMMRVFHGFYGKQSRLLGAKVKEGVFTTSQYLAARKKLKHAQPGGPTGTDGKGRHPSLLARRASAAEAVSSLSLYKVTPAMPSLADLRERLLKEGADLPRTSRSASPLPPGCAASGTAAGVLSGTSVQSRKLAQSMMAMHCGSNPTQRGSGASSPIPGGTAGNGTRGSYYSSDDEVAKVTGSPSTCSSPLPSGGPIMGARSSGTLRPPAMSYAARMHMRVSSCTPDPEDLSTLRGSSNSWCSRPSCDGPQPPAANRRASIDEAPRPSTTLESLTQSLATVSKSGVSHRVRQRSLLLLVQDEAGNASSAPQLAALNLGRSSTPTRRPDPCTCEDVEVLSEPHNLLSQAAASWLDGPSDLSSSAASQTQIRPNPGWAMQLQLASASVHSPAVSSALPPGSAARTSPPEAGTRTPASSRTSCNSPSFMSGAVTSSSSEGLSRVRGGLQGPVCSGTALRERTTHSPSSRASCDRPPAVSGWFAPVTSYESPSSAHDACCASPKLVLANRRRSFDCNWATQARLALATAQGGSSMSGSHLNEEGAARCQSPSVVRPPAGRSPGASGNIRRRSLVELNSGAKDPVCVPEGPAPAPAPTASAAAVVITTVCDNSNEKDKWGHKLPSLLMNIMPGRRSKDMSVKKAGNPLPAI